MAKTPSATESADSRSTIRDRVVAAIILVCMGVALFWLILSSLARRPWEAFDLTFEDFEGFEPSVEGGDLQKLRVRASPHEPNIVAFRYQDAHGDVFVRLVHGYNMVDCMRIKGYTAELLADTRDADHGGGGDHAPLPPRIQVWRLTSPEGETSIWATSIIDAATFAKTPVDVRAMLFPRVGIPDAVGYSPKGLTWDSLEDPIGTFRLFLRAEWNKSRADWLTFLKLRRPAWADERMLTLVSRTGHRSIAPGAEMDAAFQVASVHERLQRELHRWRSTVRR